jgi:hypothetical protein
MIVWLHGGHVENSGTIFEPEDLAGRPRQTTCKNFHFHQPHEFPHRRSRSAAHLAPVNECAVSLSPVDFVIDWPRGWDRSMGKQGFTPPA